MIRILTTGNDNYFQKPIALSILLLFLLFSDFVNGQVFVKSDAQGAKNGTSWADAYTNLDSAIKKTASGEVWVATGVYKPSVTFGSHPYPAFNITKNISLYGGFKGDETSLAQRNVSDNPTILSGDIGITGDNLDNTQVVIAITGSLIDSTCIIDGFTITKAWYRQFAYFDYDAGAVYISTDAFRNCNPIVRNCIIKENFGFDGAGIYVRSSNPTIINNLITNNTAYQGAGIYLDYFGDAKVMGNRIINNKCVGGFSHLSGGGIQIEAYCSPYIVGNLIDHNQSGHYGGGISVESNYQAVISNNIISNNTSKDGGGIYIDNTATDIINNLIIGNKAIGSGGGIFADYSYASRSINNTFVSNSADIYGSAVYLQDGNMKFKNTIIFSNPTRNNKQFTSLNPNRKDWFPTIEYCNIEGGIQGISFSDSSKLDSIWRGGNISTYPNFIDSANSNFRLRPMSVCIDAGTPDTIGLFLPMKDLGGANRLTGPRVDMGCYEYDSSFVNPDSLIVSPTWVNLEGRADSTFLLTILASANWSIASKPDWITIGNTSGNNPATMQVTALANPSLVTRRSGEICFLPTGIAPPVTVKINQSGFAFLNITPDTLYINSQENDSAVFNVFSNLAWTFASPPSWLSFNKYIGSNNSVITAKVSANNNGFIRYGQVFIYSTTSNIYPSISSKLTIAQLPAYKILCQNGTDSITTGVSATTYQWQVNTGSGFQNIIDNANYNGSNNKWLKLINIPSSFYGYKYRCAIGNSYSNVYTLKIQNTWTGAISNQWEDPLNWSCGLAPDAYVDVFIPHGNVFVNASTTVGTLTISPGANITVVAGVQLTILK